MRELTRVAQLRATFEMELADIESAIAGDRVRPAHLTLTTALYDRLDAFDAELSSVEYHVYIVRINEAYEALTGIVEEGEL